MINDIEEARRCLKRVSIRNPPFPVLLEIHDTGRLTITLTVKDRDHGFEVHVMFDFEILLPITDAIFLEVVESRLRAAWLHELHECYHVDGVRINDPHPTSSRSFDLVARDLMKPLPNEVAKH